MIRPVAVFASSFSLLATACSQGVDSRGATAPAPSICSGLSEAEVRAAFGALSADVAKVEAVRERAKTKPFVERSVGADIYVRATPGMTAQWLGRLMQCHGVYESSGGSWSNAPCPLALPGVTTDVSAAAASFIVAIRSKDVDVAREIARRSKAVFASPASQAKTDERKDVTPL